MKGKLKICTYSLVSLALIFSDALFWKDNKVEAASKSFSFSESTSQTQTQVITLPNLTSVNSVTSNTGSASVQSISGDSVTIRITGGASSRSVQTGGSPADTKWVTGQTSSYYNSGGYSGSLGSYVYSGSYTSSDTKWVTGQSSSYYSSGGYSGSLSSYKAGDTYVPGPSKTVTEAGSSYEIKSRAMIGGVCQGSHVTSPSSKSYSSGGYSGTLSYSGYTWRDGWMTSGAKSGDCAISDFYDQKYSGTVSMPGSYNPYYLYEGYVTKPSSDTRTYRYEGYVSKPDTRTYQYYYQYNITVNYEDNVAPTTPGVFSNPTSLSKVKGGSSIIVDWGDSTDGDGDPIKYELQFYNGVSWTTLVSSLTSSSYSHTLPGVDTTNAKYRVRAYDGTVYSPYQTSDAFVVDSTNPTGTITQNPTVWTNTDVDITVVASDSGGSGFKRIKLPNGTYVNDTNTVYTVGSNGTYNFVLEDYAGNTTTKTITVSNIDKIAPTITFNPTSRGWDFNDVDVNVTLKDTGGSQYKLYRYAWSNSSGKPATGWSVWSPNSTEILKQNQDGKWYLHVEAKDNVGNLTYQYAGVYKLDNTAPTLIVDDSQIKDEGSFSYLVRNKLKFSGETTENNKESDVKVYYYIEDVKTNKKFTDVDKLILDKASNVTNEAFSSTYYIEDTMPNGEYELVVYAVNNVGLKTTVKIPFKVRNPISNGSEIKIYPQPTGKWEKEFTDVYVTENGDVDGLSKAVKKYEVTNSPIPPVNPLNDLPANKKIKLNKVGENYVHLLYTFEDGSKITQTAGPYLIDTSIIGDFEMKIVDENDIKINDWTNKTAYLSINKLGLPSISGEKIQYRIENYHNDWQDYQDGLVIPFEGEYRIFGRIVNNAGTVSPQKVTTAKIDYTKPSYDSLILDKTTDGTYNAVISVKDELSGVKEAVIDGVHVKSSSGKLVNFNGLVSKPNAIVIKDKAGNETSSISFADEPIISYELPYKKDDSVYRSDVVAKLTASNQLSYKIGNRSFDCASSNCDVTINRNTNFTVINTEGDKVTKVTETIKNIDKSKLNLLLDGNRDNTDAKKVTFDWNYELTNGNLICSVAGRNENNVINGSQFVLMPAENSMYDCYIEGSYGGELLKSNHVIVYPDSSLPIESGNGVEEKKVKENIYIEELNIGTGYFINIRQNNYKYDYMPIPENKITKD